MTSLFSERTRVTNKRLQPKEQFTFWPFHVLLNTLPLPTQLLPNFRFKFASVSNLNLIRFPSTPYSATKKSYFVREKTASSAKLVHVIKHGSN